MPSQLIAFALILLAAFSNRGVNVNDLKNRLTVQLLGTPKNETTISQNSIIVPQKVDQMADAASGSRAAYFVDANTGEVLYSKNANEKLPMASTTKLMTAIVAVENLDQNKIITVPQLNTLPLDAVMGLSTGDKIKVSELMHGLLIESGADAAETLAIAAAGSEQKFVAIMNEKAKQFGLTDTQFINVVGTDDANHYSTAKDLAKLARIAISNKEIAEIASEKTYTAYSTDGKSYFLANTNLLLSDPNYKGLKTGTTLDAGQCLISYYYDGQRKIIGVVLASPDRFSDTQNIIGWTKQVFKW